MLIYPNSPGGEFLAFFVPCFLLLGGGDFMYNIFLVPTARSVIYFSFFFVAGTWHLDINYSYSVNNSKYKKTSTPNKEIRTTATSTTKAPGARYGKYEYSYIRDTSTSQTGGALVPCRCPMLSYIRMLLYSRIVPGTSDTTSLLSHFEVHTRL